MYSIQAYTAFYVSDVSLPMLLCDCQSFSKESYYYYYYCIIWA